MNEKEYKTIVIGSIICFLVLLFLQSITSGTAFRRANIQIDCLERELADARKRVEDCAGELEDSRGTIEQCYNSVGRIAEDVRRQSNELSEIIGNLILVREEVENMENALNFFYDKYGYNDNSLNNNGGELN